MYLGQKTKKIVLGAKLGPHCSTAGSSELNDECDEGDEAGDDVAERNLQQARAGP